MRLVAPILSFTADEVWGYLPALEGREKSVHIAQFPTATELLGNNEDRGLTSDFEVMRSVRESALKVLETARTDKKIGKALEARLIVRAPRGDVAGALSRHEASVAELFGVSQVELDPIDPVLGDAPVLVEFAKAEGTRCERCWRYTDDVGTEGMYPNVCARCADALEKIGFAPFDSDEEQAA